MDNRMLYSTGFFVATWLLLFAFYLEIFVNLEPCPLCILQRGVLFILMLLFLIARLHLPRNYGNKIYASVACVLSSAGLGLASRHLWLQSLPADQVPSCGPGLDYMLSYFPPLKTLEMILQGSGECASVDWSFLGLSIPSWTFLVFLLGIVWSVLIFRSHRL